VSSRKVPTHNDDHIMSIKPPRLDNPACYDNKIDPEIFFPLSTEPSASAEAKAVCRRCPEVIKCAEFAMSDLRVQGVWGGLTWEQRKDLTKQILIEGGNK